jgi:hypothetical protein
MLHQTQPCQVLKPVVYDAADAATTFSAAMGSLCALSSLEVHSSCAMGLAQQASVLEHSANVVLEKLELSASSNIFVESQALKPVVASADGNAKLNALMPVCRRTYLYGAWGACVPHGSSDRASTNHQPNFRLSWHRHASRSYTKPFRSVNSVCTRRTPICAYQLEGSLMKSIQSPTLSSGTTSTL